jgi:hypothetical protein
MPRLFLRALLFVGVAVALSACATRPQPVDDVPRMLEIRDAVVTSGPGVSKTILRNTERQLKKAIRTTERPVPMPRAIMQVHIAGVGYGTAYDGVTAQSDVNVVLVDVDSGMAILNQTFAIQAFAFDKRSLNNALVEAIVARLRIEFSLSQPTIRQPLDNNYRLSTRMVGDQPVLAKHEKFAPPVVPLKSARRIGADEDPILNSRTKVTAVEKPAKAVVLPDAKVKPTTGAASTENPVESGATAKVSITPKAVDTAPAGNEPCVETMDKKC